MHKAWVQVSFRIRGDFLWGGTAIYFAIHQECDESELESRAARLSLAADSDPVSRGNLFYVVPLVAERLFFLKMKPRHKKKTQVPKTLSLRERPRQPWLTDLWPVCSESQPSKQQTLVQPEREVTARLEPAQGWRGAINTSQPGQQCGNKGAP